MVRAEGLLVSPLPAVTAVALVGIPRLLEAFQARAALHRQDVVNAGHSAMQHDSVHQSQISLRELSYRAFHAVTSSELLPCSYFLLSYLKHEREKKVSFFPK